jgi:transposase
MPRLMLTSELWSKLKPIILQHKVHDKPNLRMTIEGVLYRMKVVGCPRRDLPYEFGDWNTVYKRYNFWSSKNIFMSVFRQLSQEMDTEWEFIDGRLINIVQKQRVRMNKRLV